MKKIICLLFCAGLMCSCGSNASEAPKISLTEETTAAEASERVTKIPPAEPVTTITFENAEAISDGELIEIALQNLSSSYYIGDYADYGSYNAVIVPENEDFESYTSAFERFPVAYEEKYKDNVIEKLSENELYSEWVNNYTELRSYLSNNVPAELPIERSYRYFFLKNIRKTADGKLKYTGSLTAEDIKQNFDIFNKDIKIARKVSETDDSFIYDFYSVEHIGGDYGLCGIAVLEHKQITVSKSDGIFGDPVIISNRSVEIPETKYWSDTENCY